MIVYSFVVLHICSSPIHLMPHPELAIQTAEPVLVISPVPLEADVTSLTTLQDRPPRVRLHVAKHARPVRVGGGSDVIHAAAAHASRVQVGAI